MARENELLLLRVLESRMHRALEDDAVDGDLESTLRQAGAAYRERVAPLRPDDLRRLRG